ncbi:LOW QUALITY PROTEIN: F-box protein PP2-B11-like [Cajanus cajan]|uniref:LOW QUALITY PROTEIN: F-box protein PP2-B11-like n=1 Tax=Cajanus cajan TaxID=3821 RepID=UPI0010FB42BB|nr:LOW QUALITY PROTEIN: F-box protein PP2-B11-like [Cajanus cajan]
MRIIREKQQVGVQSMHYADYMFLIKVLKRNKKLESVCKKVATCIANILCGTTPADACRLSLVSKVFRSAAESDVVWERFLPSDIYQFPLLLNYGYAYAYAPKKALYLALANRPIIIEQGTKSFQLHKKTGNKCYMLAARSLAMACANTHYYWIWITDPDSRFPEVADLRFVWSIVFRGVINTLVLSPNTQYVAILVFKMIYPESFYNCPMELSVGILGGHGSTKFVCLDPIIKFPNDRVVGLQRPILRSDGWLEIEMGEFFNTDLEAEVQMSVTEVMDDDNDDVNVKCGLFIEGIEIRPKE